MPVCTSIYINTEEARRVAVCGKAPNRDKYPQLCVPTGGIIEVSLMAERDREGEEIIGRRNGIIVKPVQFSSQSNLLRLGTYKRKFSSIPYSSRKFSPTCTAQVSCFTRMIFYATRMVSSNSSAVIPNSPKKTAHSYEPYTPTHFRATKAMMQGEFLAKIQQVMLDDDDSNTADICQENTGNDTTPLTKEEIISDLINNMEIWLALHRCCTSHGHITETLSNMLRCTVLQLTRKRMTDRALRLYRLLSDFGVSLGKSEVVALFSNIAYDIDSPTDRDQGKGSGLYSLVPRTKQHTAPSFNPRHPNVVSIREHKQTSFSPNYSDASPYADHLSLKNCVLSAQPPLATSSCDTKGEHCFTYNHLTNHTLNVDISNLLVRPPELTTASSPASVGTRDRSWIFRESRVLRDYWYEVAIGTMDALSFCYPLYQIDIREYNRDVSGEITSVISDCQDLDDAKHYTRSCKDVDAKPVVEHYDGVAKHSEYEATETHHLPLKTVFNDSAVDSCGDVTSPPNSISGDSSSSTSTSSRDSVLLPCKNVEVDVARKAISETLELNLNYTAAIEPSISIFTKIKPNPIEDTPKSLVTVRDRRPIRGKDEAAFLLSLKTLGQWSTHDKGGERGHYTPPFTSSSSCKSSSMPLQISSKGGWITALQLWASKYLEAPFATGPLQPIRNNNTTNHTNNRKNNNTYAKIQVLPPLLSRNISRRAIECLFVILLAMPARIAQIHYASSAGDSEGDAPYPLPSGYPLLVEWGPLSVANAVLRAIDNTKQRELGEHTLHNLANVTGAETGGDSKVSDANIDKGDSICPSRELLANHISATPPHKTERSQNLLSVEACRLGARYV